jgi:predicted ATP-grasp superfamily ATP-dependent carboligase
MYDTYREKKALKRTLVTDAQLRASLAIIRSLGKQNIKVTAVSEIRSAMGLFSKYCSKKLISPNPRDSPNLFLKYLLDLVKKNDYECIIPSHTYTMFLLCKYRDLFADYIKLPPPNFDVFYNAYDKKKLIKIALQNGIACPKTYFYDDLDEIVSNISQYPVVVKSSRRHGVGIAICYTVSDLRENYVKMVNKYGPCLVQEYVPNGGEFGIYTLFNFDSEPILLTVQKRIGTRYYYGGISTMRETVKNESLVKIAFHLLKTIKWSGVAMVEFRIDKQDGTPKLMEINPRFWGSLQLSILAGADFPFQLYKLMMNDYPSPKLNFKDGVQCRWLMGDPADFFRHPAKLNTNSDFRSIFNDDIISLTDPVPMIVSSFFPIKNSSDEEQRKDDDLIMRNKLTK